MANYPVGSIIVWPLLSSTIPSGWQAADGSCGTIDLRGAFPVGAGGTYSALTSGGSSTINVQHTHVIAGYYTLSTAGTHSHSIAGSNSNAASGNSTTVTTLTPTVGALPMTHTHPTLGATYVDGSHTHSLTGTQLNNSATALGTYDAMPPYRAYVYIQRTS